MRYLLLIPACLALLASLVFYGALLHYRWGKWRTAVLLVAALGFQLSAIVIAGLVDR